MKFALYQPWIYLQGGLERSLLELVTRSRHTWVIYTSHYEPENTFSGFRKLQVTQLRPVSVNRDMLSVLLAAQRIFRQKLPLSGLDGLVIWCDGLGDLLTFRNSQLPVFNICSTPLRAVFDPTYEELACREASWLKRLAYKSFKYGFRLVDQRAWKRYAGVIATSTEVKHRILNGGLYKDGPRMKLCYPGIDWQAFAGPVTYEPFLLVPGRIARTKNIELAVEAFARAALPAPWRLVVAGFLDKKSRPYIEQLKSLAGGNLATEFIVSPADRELAELYRRAAVVLFPPLNEDWGIVPLEAMACSKPVLANARGGPRESVLDGRTGWLLPPQVEAWAAVMRKFPEQLEVIKRMGAQARAHVRQYDWAQFVSGVDAALEAWVTASAIEGSGRQRVP